MKCLTKPSIIIAIVAAAVTCIIHSMRTAGGAHALTENIDADYEASLNANGAKTSNSNSFNASKVNRAENVESIPLLLPDGAVVVDYPVKESLVARNIASEDAILAAGGIQVASTSILPLEDKASREKRLASITAKDWQSQPNLLVNEIRAARGFQIPLTNVEAFLSGKDMQGWNDGQRNWIGDELMIMLRQEVPQEAYRIFQNVLADASSPDAMRDYSVQHISHLVAAGQVGKEGVTVIRNALESGDPIYASTALVSLHRLSTTQPQFISPEQVAKIAKQLENSPDQRTQLTAKAIGVEWTNAKK